MATKAKKSKSTSYEKVLIARLKTDPELAAEYLNATIDDPDPQTFLIALKDVVKASGGMLRVSREANLNKGGLYKVLSGERNPKIASIHAILRASGFKFQITPIPKLTKKKKNRK